MEFPYPQSDPIEYAVAAVHIMMAAVAFCPIFILYYQCKRPAISSDAWTYFFLILLAPTFYVPTSQSMYGSGDEIILGCLLQFEVLAISALIITHNRLKNEGVTSVAGWLLVSLGFFAFMFFLLLPMNHHHTPSMRTMCQNHLKQLGLGVQCYADVHRSYPNPIAYPGQSVNVSWRVRITPFIEESEIGEQYDMSQVWNAPDNAPFGKLHIPAFDCPMVEDPYDSKGYCKTSYSIPLGKGTFFGDGKQIRKLDEDATPLSLTLMIVEANGQNIIWSEPREVNVDRVPIGINLAGSRPGWSDGLMSSLHSKMAMATFLDGSVDSFPQDTDPEILRAFLSGSPTREQGRLIQEYIDK